MTTITSQKFFCEVVAITGGTAISLADLMKAAGWGFLKDSDNNITTERGTDSFMAEDGAIIPLGGTLYVGHDRFVRNAAAAGPPRVYQGVPTAVNVPFNLGVRNRGIDDASHIWLYSVGDQNLSIIFGGF